MLPICQQLRAKLRDIMHMRDNECVTVIISFHDILAFRMHKFREANHVGRDQVLGLQSPIAEQNPIG